MMTPLERALQVLQRALLTARIDPAAAGIVGDKVALALPAVMELGGRLAYHEGGARGPFIRALIARPNIEGVQLSSDEALHLGRALGDIADRI